ncbi:hypothetical protein GW915_01495 [bacterium]|nr:hypothetical protein [bacterium]
MELKLKWTLNGIVALVMSVAPCVFAQSQDGAQEPSQIKSQLTLEDLETVLTSSSFKDETLQGLRLSELSPTARKQLLAKVSVLKDEMTKRIKEVDSKNVELKEKLRAERRSIQQERMRVYGPMDEQAKMKLFSNLLDEANIDAMDSGDRRQIESEYLVTITTKDVEDMKSLKSIATKKANLWTEQNSRRIAQN